MCVGGDFGVTFAALGKEIEMGKGGDGLEGVCKATVLVKCDKGGVFDRRGEFWFDYMVWKGVCFDTR